MAAVFDDTLITAGSAVRFYYTESGARAISGNVRGVFGCIIVVEYRANGRQQVILVSASDLLSGAVEFSWTDSAGEWQEFDSDNNDLVGDDGMGGGGGTVRWFASTTEREKVPNS